MIINPDNNTTIWYHTTLRDRVPSILSNGLKIFSPSSGSGHDRVPWLYISSKPLISDKPIFKVDLAGVKEDAVKELFDSKVDDCIYQRIFIDIEPDRLSLMSKTFCR